MTRLHPALIAQLERTNVLSTTRHPALRKAICAAAADGHLRRVLPGIYVPADAAGDPLTRMEALQTYRPDTIFVGRSAAGLIWGPKWLPAKVQATGRLRMEARGFSVKRRAIPEHWTIAAGGLRCTNPVLTAVDLIPTKDGARFLDDLLRQARGRGGEVLAMAWEALRAFPGRPGNVERELILHDSRDHPWSEMERRAHRQLRGAGISGWETNQPIPTGIGTLWADLLFRKARVIPEVDGWEYHSTRAAFERDRERHNAFVAAGWTVLLFTWTQVTSGAWLKPLSQCLEAAAIGPQIRWGIR